MTSLEIINATMIVSPDQKQKLVKIMNSAYDIITIDINNEYQLSKKEDSYIVLSLEIIGLNRDKKDIMAFISHLDFVCLRFENTKDIFVRNYNDLIDLELDYYIELGPVDFLKDMLSISERYAYIFKSSTKIHQTDIIALIDNLQNSNYEDINITPMTEELFCQNPEYTLMNINTGEIIEVDITKNLKASNFCFKVLKNLENI